MATANASQTESNRAILRSARPVEVAVAAGNSLDALACELIYASAEGDHSLVPWARLGPDPTLLRWLNSCACEHVRPGARAIVAGCGLGDDVAELDARGFDAKGLDASQTAVTWASRRFPSLADGFVLADLTTTPTRLHRRFDLVVDVDTIQSAACADHEREVLARGLASLLHPHGALLVVAGGGPIREDPSTAWINQPMGPEELIRLMHEQGLEPASPLDGQSDGDVVSRYAIVFRRSQ